MLVPNQGSAALVTLLLSEGALDKEDYDILMPIVRVKEQIAHGFQTEEASPELAAQLRDVTRNLMKSYLKAA